MKKKERKKKKKKEESENENIVCEVWDAPDKEKSNKGKKILVA